ncbi:MAG: hypothetical protein O2909_12165 [Chloroflexi bacterium]|nr:hypothetical protein [Chloroflexota bacterium]MDA1220174.1 hypothetical protein [Chloroflexota bacterium]
MSRTPWRGFPKSGNSITGTKSEDTVLLTADGPEVLTRTGEWPEIKVDLPIGTLCRPAIGVG